MTERLAHSLLYEQCDVAEGESLAEWRARTKPSPTRRAQVTGGLVAAIATLAPIVLSVRGSRHR